MLKLTNLITIFLIILGTIGLMKIMSSPLGSYEIQDITKQISLSQDDPQEIFLQEFITDDKKLKIKYPLDWANIETEDLKKLIPEKYIEEYDIQLPLFALKAEKEKIFQLTIMKMDISAEENIEDVIKILKEINKERGWDMDIVKKTIKEKTGILETKYQKKDQPDMCAQEKIFFLESENTIRKIYIASTSGLLKDWQGFSQEAYLIINSAQLVQ